MAAKTQTQAVPKKMKAVNWGKLQDVINTVITVSPTFAALFQQIVDLFQQQQTAMKSKADPKASPPVGCCEDALACLDEQLKSLLQAVASNLSLQDTLAPEPTPDQEDQEEAV